MIDKCSKCGCTDIYIMQTISGIGRIRIDLKRGIADYGDIHDDLTYKNVGVYWKCMKCGEKVIKDCDVEWSKLREE